MASSEVKQKLQGFLLSKKQREAAAMAGGVPIPNSASSAAVGVNPANISTPGNLKQNLCICMKKYIEITKSMC